MARDTTSADARALQPGDIAEGDSIVIHYENRASAGVREEPATVTGVQDDGTLAVEFKRDSNGHTTTLEGEVRTGYTDRYGNTVGEEDEWLAFWSIGQGRRDDVQQGSVVRITTLERKAWEKEQASLFCMECQEFHDHATPVETSHSSTGTAGCPECLDADPLRRVVYEVGDERTITYGYIPEGERDHGASITLEAAEAIAQAEGE